MKLVSASVILQVLSIGGADLLPLLPPLVAVQLDQVLPVASLGTNHDTDLVVALGSAVKVLLCNKSIH